MRILLVGLVSVLVLSFIPSPTLAADPAAGSPTLFFTPEVLSTAGPPSPSGYEECGSIVTYKAAIDAPAAAGKAGIGSSYLADACPFYFSWTAPQAFTFESDVLADAYLGCNQAGPILEVDFHLFVAGEEIDPGRHSTSYVPTVQCTGAGFVQKVEKPILAEGTPVNAGDVVLIEVGVWAANPPPASTQVNFFLVTGGATPSGITAAGLPGAASKVGSEILNLAVAKSSASAVPGGSALYNLTITNAGAATKFNLTTVDLSSTYTAAFNPLSGSLAANETGHALLKIVVPATATPNSHLTFKVKVTGTQGANKTVDLTLDIEKASTSGGPGSSGPGGTGGGGGGGGGGGSPTDDGYTTPADGSSGTKASPGFEFLANFLAIGLLVVAMRRRVQ